MKNNKPVGDVMPPLLRKLLANAQLPPQPPVEKESQLHVEYKRGCVRVVFATPTQWIALNPDAAEEFGSLLMDIAKLAREAPAPEEPRIILP